MAPTDGIAVWEVSLLLPDHYCIIISVLLLRNGKDQHNEVAWGLSTLRIAGLEVRKGWQKASHRDRTVLVAGSTSYP